LYDIFGMRHRRLHSLLSSYVDEQVTVAEAERVDRHLATCAEGRAELESLQATVGLLRSLPDLALPRSFRLTEVPESRPVAVPFAYTRPLMAAASMAAVALIAIVAVDLAEVGVSGDLVGVQAISEAPVSAMAESAMAPEESTDFAATGIESMAAPESLEVEMTLEGEPVTEMAVSEAAIGEVEVESAVRSEKALATTQEAEVGEENVTLEALAEPPPEEPGKPEPEIDSLVTSEMEITSEIAVTAEIGEIAELSEAIEKRADALESGALTPDGTDDTGRGGELPQAKAADGAIVETEIQTLASQGELGGADTFASDLSEDGFPYLPLEIAAGVLLALLLGGLLATQFAGSRRRQA